MQALIYKSTGNWYVAKTELGDVLRARIKGKFKIDGITSTNPIAVGDIVELEMENELEQTAMIIEIYERRNYINRKSPHQKYHHHIVAANLDQSMLFATMKEPRTSQGFIDRFLIASEAYQPRKTAFFRVLHVGAWRGPPHLCPIRSPTLGVHRNPRTLRPHPRR